MATTAKTIIKSWYKNFYKPTQEQFWAWMDSYWHKDEDIPMNKIEGLNEALQQQSTAGGSIHVVPMGEDGFADTANPTEQELTTYFGNQQAAGCYYLGTAANPLSAYMFDGTDYATVENDAKFRAIAGNIAPPQWKEVKITAPDEPPIVEQVVQYSRAYAFTLAEVRLEAIDATASTSEVLKLEFFKNNTSVRTLTLAQNETVKDDADSQNFVQYAADDVFAMRITEAPLDMNGIVCQFKEVQ